MAKILYIPPGYSGSSELTASNGLTVVSPGRWLFSRAGYNDGATFGLSMGWPDTAYNGEFSYGAPPPESKPLSGGLLHLQAQDWEIAGVGNSLQSYTDPTTGDVYSEAQCKITVTGYWQVYRHQNSSSYNSFNVSYIGTTSTDQGDRVMDPSLLTLIEQPTTYVIQGADVTGGARNTFSPHEFWCKVTEEASSTNSNNEFQSNTVTRPTWVYTYSMGWEITV